MDTPILQSLLRAPTSTRATLHLATHATRPQTRTMSLLLSQKARTPILYSKHQTRHLSAPRILTPSFWTSLIPKPFRPASSPQTTTPTSRPPPNPATPYIILSLLVGSQAIQILWLKREREHSLRRAEAKIGVLREVIERVQRGEAVDVEAVLGVGDEESEREWGRVVRDVGGEEVLYRSKKGRRRGRREEGEGSEAEVGGEERVGGEKVKEGEVAEAKVKVESLGGDRFY